MKNQMVKPEDSMIDSKGKIWFSQSYVNHFSFRNYEKGQKESPVFIQAPEEVKNELQKEWYKKLYNKLRSISAGALKVEDYEQEVYAKVRELEKKTTRETA